MNHIFNHYKNHMFKHYYHHYYTILLPLLTTINHYFHISPVSGLVFCWENLNRKAMGFYHGHLGPPCVVRRARRDRRQVDVCDTEPFGRVLIIDGLIQAGFR